MNLRQASILVVDDDMDVLTAVRFLLKPEVKNIDTEANPENLRHKLNLKHFDIILLDMNYNSPIMTGNEGLYWLNQIKSWNTKAQVIMITAYADIDLAVKCLKEGAADFLIKPWHNERLLQTLSEALEKRSSPEKKHPKASDKKTSSEIIGNSDKMQRLFQIIEKIAPTEANVLILGENGTGKDLIAQSIFRLSLRRDKPFVKVDVGALTDTLFESELFGHKKGAFTDAREDRMGLIEAANEGTLFLDEIGNISLSQQAKLLTVLQNRQVSRLGSNTPIPVNIRLITATNVPLSELGSEQRFRKDLIYRINTVEITVPPLRERENDILPIANHFIQIYTAKYQKRELKLSEQAKNKLMRYNYPGNVRELQYAVERAVIMADGDILNDEDIVFSPIEQKTQEISDIQTKNLEDIERNAILQVLEKHHGNMTKAAKELGLSRVALYRRFKKYGL